MKNLTKLFVDIGPLAIFFIFYTRGDLQSAILPFMIATIIAVIFSYITEKKIPIMPTVGALIILVFGGLTLYFNNDVFYSIPFFFFIYNLRTWSSRLSSNINYCCPITYH